MTARGVATITKPGMHGDGDGLYLHVSPSGAKSWILRTTIKGVTRDDGKPRRFDIGLGGLSVLSLADARSKAQDLRAVARSGADPRTVRDKSAPTVLTFKEAAEHVHAKRIVPTARNPKHRAQWINTLRDYAFPAIGEKRVDAIDSAGILRVLQPLWLSKPETARRVRQRHRTVFDWCRVAGHREAGNPLEGVELALPKQPPQTGYHPAMSWEDVPGFLAELRERQGVAASALAFTVLTAARTGEVIGARWSEIDGDVWTVPAERMKAGRSHRVPLAAEALAILEPLHGWHDDGLIFAGQRRGRPLSNMAMLQVMRRMGRGEFTPHGFRSSFRDWSEERTAFPREVKEAALAHTVRSKTERAYRRTDLFEKRRQLMEQWSRWCCRAPISR